MKFSTSSSDAWLYIAASHAGPRKDGVAAGAYAGIIEYSNGTMEEFWGYGGIRNTEELYFEAIAAGLNRICAAVQNETPRVVCCVQNKGFMKFLKRVPAWMANEGRTAKGNIPDAYETAQYCFLMKTQGNLDVIEQSLETGPELLRTVERQARRIAAIAFEKGAHLSKGNFTVGDGFDSI